MTKNPILDELHAIREKLLADAGGSLDALVDQIQANEEKSTRPRFSARSTRLISSVADQPLPTVVPTPMTR